MTHSDIVPQFLKGEGVEIGAFKTPVPGIKPHYVDKYKVYANEPCLADYYGEATALPFKSNSLNYVVASHVLEHVANPVAALAEWYRVLRPGGVIYMILPDRRYTWDHQRSLTPVAHMLLDYQSGRTAADATHIDDFVDNVDWSTFSPATPSSEVPAEKEKARTRYLAAVTAGQEINIHFHVFEPSNLLELIQTLKTFAPHPFHWDVELSHERFPAENPNGILVVVRVKKSLREKLRMGIERFATMFAKRSALLDGAGNFPT